MSARWLIAILGVVTALQNLYVLLPGNPHFSDGAIFWVLVQGVLIWLLWRGSAITWTLLVLMHGLTFVAIPLFSAGGPIEPALVGILVFAFVSLALLLARPVRRHVWGPRLPASTAPGH